MARNKSIIKNVSVSVAQRRHYCHRSKKHVITAGDRRLSVKEGRSVQHYCLDCANATLNVAVDKVEYLKRELI